MPITHRLIENRPLALVRVAGACTGSDIARTLRALARDERLQPGTNVLWDSRHLTHFSMVPGEVDAIVQAQQGLEASTGAGRTAIVVTRPEDDLVARLFVRAFESTKREIRVVTTLEEALEWLGVEDFEV